MLGWHISVYRPPNGVVSLADWDPPRSARLAVWQTGVQGLGWISELVVAGKAIELGGDGYPLRYAITAEYLMPQLTRGAQCPWIGQEEDVVTDQWEGRSITDQEAIRSCHPDEWLLVVAWDES